MSDWGDYGWAPAIEGEDEPMKTAREKELEAELERLREELNEALAQVEYDQETGTALVAEVERLREELAATQEERRLQDIEQERLRAENAAVRSKLFRYGMDRYMGELARLHRIEEAATTAVKAQEAVRYKRQPVMSPRQRELALEADARWMELRAALES